MGTLSNYKSHLSSYITNNLVANFPSHRFRNWFLRKIGMKMSKDVRFYTGFHIRAPKGITIGNGVNIGPRVLLDGRQGLFIDDNATIAYDSIIWTLNHDYNDITFCGKGAPVHIGKFAWICSRAIILPGIRVGEGAIVASGAIVTKDVDNYTIVAGVPAKVIGHRKEIDYKYGYKSAKDKSHFI